MDIKKKVFSSIKQIIQEDKQNMFYLLYYSIIEALLALSIPIASSFIINSILAHASISINVLGSVVIVVFILITALHIVKEHIIEKFQQKVFITTGIKIAIMATKLQGASVNIKQSMDKYMNYFFDISAIQKFFPILVLDGTGLVVKVFVSLLLLLAFDPLLFGLGIFFLLLFLLVILLLGKNAFKYAVERSDAKHSAIYFLQNIPYQEESAENILRKFDAYMTRLIDAREKIFKIIIRQTSLTYFLEGFIFSGFLIVGGYLVVEGKLPIGEFVAAEIIVVSITNSLKGFIKQIDYIYDMVEGFYKVDKLSSSMMEKTDVSL